MKPINIAAALARVQAGSRGSAKPSMRVMTRKGGRK